MSKSEPQRAARAPVIIGGCNCGGDLHYRLEVVADLAAARAALDSIKPDDLPVRVQRYTCRCAPAAPQRPFRPDGCGAEHVRITNRYGLLWQNGRDRARPW